MAMGFTRRRNSTHQALTDDQIRKLTEQGCTCDDWRKVEVSKEFEATKVRSTHFSGNVKLGNFNGQVEFLGGVKRPTGISNASIHNCEIGNNVYIDQVRNFIANYIIEDNVVMENVDLLATEGPTSFGNGTEVAVVNETGGRAIPIYDELSAHTAYLIAFYRHKPKVISNIKRMIADYTASVTSSRTRGAN